MSDAAEARTRRAERVRLAAAAIGVVLALIGVRFLLWPEAASRFFGIGARPAGAERRHRERDARLSLVGQPRQVVGLLAPPRSGAA